MKDGISSLLLLLLPGPVWGVVALPISPIVDLPVLWPVGPLPGLAPPGAGEAEAAGAVPGTTLKVLRSLLTLALNQLPLVEVVILKVPAIEKDMDCFASRHFL